MRTTQCINKYLKLRAYVNFTIKIICKHIEWSKCTINTYWVTYWIYCDLHIQFNVCMTNKSLEHKTHNIEGVIQKLILLYVWYLLSFL